MRMVGQTEKRLRQNRVETRRASFEGRTNRRVALLTIRLYRTCHDAEYLQISANS